MLQQKAIMVPQMIPVILALHTSVIVSTFEIASHEPKTNSEFGICTASTGSNCQSGVKYDEGDDIDLWCNADDYWEWCKFTHAQPFPEG